MNQKPLQQKRKKNSVEETDFGKVALFGHLDQARKE